MVERDLGPGEVTSLAMSVATYLAGKGARKLIVGRDCRLHSPSIAGTMIGIFAKCGFEVLDIGVVPTPVFYFSLFNFNADGGVMVTASHNPSEYNGLKVACGKSTIFGEEIQALRKIIDAGAFMQSAEKAVIRSVDAVTPYIEYVSKNIKPGKRRLKVVVDAGNGTGGVVALPLMKKLGIETIPLFCEMDGRFSNHHPDPTVPANLETLISKVRDSGADLGISYDGDSDRLGVVDEKGGISWGDQLMMIFARAILAEKPGSTFIAEVKCSKTLYDDIEKHGGKAIMWRTGHSLIKAKMKEVDAELAGEMSGHIFFKHRYLGFDDAIYSSLRLLEILSKTESPMSGLLADVPKSVSTPEIRMDCPEERKFQIVKKLTEYFKNSGYKVVDIDGARVEFQDGWGLVRASNTQPLIVLRFEADTGKRLEEIRKLIEGKLKELM